MGGNTAQNTARRVVASVAALAAVGLLAAACGSSSSSTTTTAAAASGATTTTAASGATTTTAGGTSAMTKALAFATKFKSGEHATYTATYKVTSSTTSKVTTFSITQQGANSKFEVTSGTGVVSFITVGGKGYYCEQSSSTTSCFDAGSTGASMEAAFSEFQSSDYLPEIEALATAHGAHLSYSTRTVNGIPAQCVTATGLTGETGSGTFCVTSSGVLALVQTTGTHAGSFELTSYSTSVPSDAFTLPAKPTSLP